MVLLAIHSKKFGNTTDSGRLFFKRLEVMPVTLETNIITLIIYRISAAEMFWLVWTKEEKVGSGMEPGGWITLAMSA